MSHNSKHTGFAIAIAWPETFCKQPGYWYDYVTTFLGISNNHYYKIGHAALVLIDSETKKCNYFDFGRYHTPFQHGRVRSELTDPALKINTKAVISNDGNTIENYHDILNELQLNSECHGEGKIHASYCKVNYKKAMEKALHLQSISPIPYGPFKYKGSNCSRFVNEVILGGKPLLKYRIKLNYLVLLTPTPLNNVNSLDNKVVLPKLLTNTPFCPAKIICKNILQSTLPEPNRNIRIPDNAQWLSGEGCGSWFNISKTEENYQITRYGLEGEIEFQHNYIISDNKNFDINLPYKFDYPSHSKMVTVQQNFITTFVNVN